MANLPGEHQSLNLFTPPAGGWPENGWQEASVGNPFWHSHNITMPASKHIPVIARSSLIDAVEPMCKSEPMAELPPIAERNPKWQRTGGHSEQRGFARPELVQYQPITEDLPHVPYQTARQSASNSSFHCVEFRAEGGAGDGFPLKWAFENKLETLAGGNEPSPFEEASAKVSIRIQFDGCEPYTRQIMARRSTAKAEPISKKILAHKIAQEVYKYLTEAYDTGRPPMHRGRHVGLQDLYLCRLEQVSPGSWVPMFKVIPRISH